MAEEHEKERLAIEVRSYLFLRKAPEWWLIPWNARRRKRERAEPLLRLNLSRIGKPNSIKRWHRKNYGTKKKSYAPSLPKRGKSSRKSELDGLVRAFPPMSLLFSEDDLQDGNCLNETETSNTKMTALWRRALSLLTLVSMPETKWRQTTLSRIACTSVTVIKKATSLCYSVVLKSSNAIARVVSILYCSRLRSEVYRSTGPPSCQLLVRYRR
jgi:hypothetical protein